MNEIEEKYLPIGTVVLLKDATKRGYDVNSRATSRVVSSTYIPTPYFSYYSYTSAPGTQYTVRRPKKKR